GFTGEYFQSAIIGWITCCIIELLVRFFSDSDDYNYYKKELAEYKNKLSEYRETVLEINRVKSDCKKILEEKIDQLKPYFANYPEIDLYDYSEKSTSAKMVKIVSVLAKYGKIDNMDSAMTAYNKIETIGCSYSDLDMIFEGFNKLTIDEALEMYKYIKSKHVSIEDAMSYIKPDITDNIDEAIELYEVDCSADLYRKMCKFKLASSVPEALNVCKIIKYNNSAPVKKVLDYIVDGKCRATSLSEALNFYAEDCHRRHMEEIAKENLESQLRLEQAEKDREERYRQIQEEAYMKANDHRREEEKREARDRGRSQCFSCQNLGPCRFSDDNYGNCGAFRPKI
ncbi:MAG: hypothetical protein Q4C64_03610, partial [Erysipelotrichia bacterium]|nr:hypothetical protein [Erysipelotrichia bacterium]